MNRRLYGDWTWIPKRLRDDKASMARLSAYAAETATNFALELGASDYTIEIIVKHEPDALSLRDDTMGWKLIVHEAEKTSETYHLDPAVMSIRSEKWLIDIPPDKNPVCPHCFSKMTLCSLGASRMFWGCTCEKAKHTKYITSLPPTGEEKWS